MSTIALVDRHLDLLALAALVDVRVEKHDYTRRLYVAADAWNALPSSTKQRVHASVTELGIEAWCEHGEIVFHVAHLALHAEARRAHARRVAFLLGRVAR